MNMDIRQGQGKTFRSIQMQKPPAGGVPNMKMPSEEDMRSMIPKAPVKVVNKSKHGLPQYETSGASGMDAKANLDVPQIEIRPGETALVPTGLFVEIPLGLEIQVRPRSGLSLKTKIRVSNSPGTVDSCYRGEIKIIMENTGEDGFIIKDGDRVAQLVLCPVIKCEWVETDKLSDTDRGEGGFGSTGK